MILIDSNVPMYLVGADHPYKLASQQLLDDAVLRGEALVTDVEVFQEILHRYTAIDRLDAIQPAFDALAGIVDDVLPVSVVEVEFAKRIVLGRYGLSARDAIHVAVMQSYGVTRVMSFDTGFDRYPGIDRVA
jgi:uncharacterized protein